MHRLICCTEVLKHYAKKGSTIIPLSYAGIIHTQKHVFVTEWTLWVLTGANSAAVVKRLKCLTDCLAEIATARLPHPPPPAAAAADESSGMRGAVTGIPGAQVASASHPDDSSRGGVMGVPGVFLSHAMSSLIINAWLLTHTEGQNDMKTLVSTQGSIMVQVTLLQDFS
jgi:hypothetical protein